MAERLARFKAGRQAAGVPAIYVNDNFGRWRSDFNAQVEHCLQDGVRGQPLVELLRPDDDDYFVLKPKHSGFFSTTLDMLLEYLGASTLILTGMAATSASCSRPTTPTCASCSCRPIALRQNTPGRISRP